MVIKTKLEPRGKTWFQQSTVVEFRKERADQKGVSFTGKGDAKVNEDIGVSAEPLVAVDGAAPDN